jgi:FkbM family methyltransferase
MSGARRHVNALARAVVQALTHPRLAVAAVRQRGLRGTWSWLRRSFKTGFAQQPEYAALLLARDTPHDLLQACSWFAAAIAPADAETYLVHLRAGPRLYVRRASAKSDLWLLSLTFHTAQWLAEYDVRGQTVLDIGANLGDTAVYFGLRGARVISFEPSPVLAALARRNCALNGVAADIRACGIGDCRRSLWLRSTGRLADAASSVEFPGVHTNERTEFAGGAREVVEVVGLGEVLAETGEVFLAKINCEGCEYPALGSLSRDQLRLVRHYTIDCHADPDVIAARLREAGFDVRKPKPGLPLFADRRDGDVAGPRSG